MKIAEYKLHGNPNGKGMVTPGFIQNGGYYHNPDDHTMLGFVDDPAEYYLPDTLVFYTLAEAKLVNLLSMLNILCKNWKLLEILKK